MYMEMQGTQNVQNDLEKEEKSWRTHTSSFQNLLRINRATVPWHEGGHTGPTAQARALTRAVAWLLTRVPRPSEGGGSVRSVSAMSPCHRTKEARVPGVLISALRGPGRVGEGAARGF